MEGRSELRKNSLNLVHSIAIGVAGTAPSYTIAASTAVLIGAVGAAAPASLFYCGLVMVGITFAFANLNRIYPDSGASYEWVGRVFNRDLGFLAGWAVLVSSALFMVSATIPAATATLLLVAPGVPATKGVVLALSALWVVAVSLVLVRGVYLTGVVQTVMTAVDVVVLAALALIAFVRYGPQALAQISWHSFAPGAFGPGTFSAGAVIALFFFWGWDVSLNVSEETRDSGRTPGRAAVLALLVIVSAFMAFAVVTLAVLTEPEIQASGANVLFAIAEKLLPRPWSYLAVIAVMLSSVGSLEACVLAFARTMFATSRAGEMHPRWSQVHPRWGTPHLATYLITVLGLLLLALSLAFPSIEALLGASINAIGLEVAFYYGLAALACAWRFRAEAARPPRVLIFAVAWPLASALGLLVVVTLAVRSMDATTLVIGLGGLALGLVPLAWLRAQPRSARASARR